MLRLNLLGVPLQVSRVEASQAVQRKHPDRPGLPEAALLHRQGRGDVQAHPQLHEELQAPHP